MPAGSTPQAQIAENREPARTNIPFVELNLRGQTIDLIDYDAAAGKLTGGRASNPSKNRLLLIDFTYIISKRTGVGNDLQLTVLDPQWEYLERILIENHLQPVMSFRYGWRGRDDKVGTPPITLLIVNWEVDFQPFQGAVVKIRAKDASFQLNNEAETGSFPTNTLVSSAIASMINGNSNLIPDVERTSNTVGAENNLLNNRTPMQYIRDLLEIARSAVTGSNEYVMTTHPQPDGRSIVRVRSDNAVSGKVARKYIFGREIQGQVFSFTPQYLGNQIIQTGGVKVAGVFVDPLTKSLRKLSTDQGEDDVEAPLRPFQTPKKDNRIVESPYTNPQDTEAHIKRTRVRSSQMVYRATSTILGDTKLQVRDQLEFQVLKFGAGQQTITQDQIHHTSGLYRVDKIQHIISNGIFRTNLELFRGGSKSGLTAEGNLVQVPDIPSTAGEDLTLAVERLPSADPAFERELRSLENDAIGFV